MSDRKKLLNASLTKAMNLHNLYSSREFQDFLLPVLKELSVIQHLKPSDFVTREEFARAAELSFEKANTYQELIAFLQGQEATMNKIRQELEKPEKDWGI